MVDEAKSHTQLAQLTTGVVVAIVLLFLTKPLEYLPNAVLSAVVFLIGVKLINVKAMSEISRLRQDEFWVAVTTAAVVVIFGVEQGIILAMILSIIEHIYHSYRPFDTFVVPDGSGSVRTEPVTAAAPFAPGVYVYRFGAALYYANASRFTEEIVTVLESAPDPIHTFVIDAEAMTDVDYSGSDSLRQIQEEMQRHGATLILAEVTDQVRKLLDAYGLTDVIGAANFYPTTRAAIEAATASQGSGEAPAGGPAPASDPA